MAGHELIHPERPCYPLMLPYEVTIPRPSCMASSYAGLAVPSGEMTVPHFYSMVIKKPSPKESRKFFLDRSIFQLVNAHPYLALTDPNLLGWYLCLSPEDRKIIQDEGGFYHFLQRHPALELSSHHVYVKYNFGSVSAAQPSMTSNKNISTMSGGTNECRCEMTRTHFALKMFPNKLRETLTLLTERQVHVQDSTPTALNSPITQEPRAQNAHTVKMKTEKGSLLSELKEDRPSCQVDSSNSSSAVEVELKLCRQGGRPELRNQREVTQGQSAIFVPLQSEMPTVETESSSVDTVDDKEASASFEDQSDISYSIMEDDKSILACRQSEDAKTHNNGVHSHPVTTNNETLDAKSESDQSVIRMNKCTSLLPCVATSEIMTGTEPSVWTSTFTHTEEPQRADKHVVTEVHKADLDYLTEELKMAEEELREQKEKIKRFCCKVKKECECIQRTQQAELRFLALQYSMCRLHCWRLYYTSKGCHTLPELPPANIVSVLQQLEFDYNQMRHKILAGVPLEQLRPLYVDSEKITTGTCYSPAQHCQREEQIEKTSNMRSAVTFFPHYKDAVQSANKEEENQTPECKDINISEAWHDAMEDLEPSGSAAAADTGRTPQVIQEDANNESTKEEAKWSVLCVSNLPKNVTESDVMQWFEQYNGSEVSICALKNDLRIAIVMISGTQSAEAAVKELNGCSMQGHTLHVVHISHSRASASISGSESSENAIKPQNSKTESSRTERKVITEPPPRSSMEIRKVFCITPTAMGTCVPQQYGTMGSFDTLIMELTEHHPDVGRQRIVDALMELKSLHQGILSALPLRTIREMTSELLSRPKSATHL